MTTSDLIGGALFRNPEQKTSKAKKAYATAKLRVAADNAIDFWNIVAFSDSAQAGLMRLRDGDRLSAQGALTVEIYVARDGSTKINRSILVDQVLALRQPPRERKSKPAPKLNHRLLVGRFSCRERRP